MLWKKINNFVGFDNPELSLENKLFNAICLLVALCPRCRRGTMFATPMYATATKYCY